MYLEKRKCFMRSELLLNLETGVLVLIYILRIY